MHVGRLTFSGGAPRLVRFGAAGALYVALSAALYWPLPLHPATMSLENGQGDVALLDWWLAWTPLAVGHGLNPLYTHYWNAPYGVDAMWNGSVLALGLLFSPITVLFGAIVTFNVIALLCPVVTGLATFAWLCRHVRWPAALAGGGLLAFSTFMVRHGSAHIHLTFLLAVPLILMLVEDLAWRHPRPSWRSGLYLGLLVVFQWFVSTEVLVIISGACLVELVVLAILCRDKVVPAITRALPGIGVAAAVSLVLLAPALADQFASSHVISGPLQKPFTYQDRTRDIVTAPGDVRWFHTAAGTLAVRNSEQDIYIGLPLLLLLGVAVVMLRRHRGVVVAAAIALVSYVLALGGSGPGGSQHRWFLPWSLLGRLPLLKNALPDRFSLVFWLAVVFIFATALDNLPRLAARRPWQVLVAAVVLATLIPLVPLREPVGRVPTVPRFFTTSQVHVIAQGANVLVVPLGHVGSEAGITWQVRAGLRFAQPANLAFRPGPSSSPLYATPPDAVVLDLFEVDKADRYFAGPWTPSLRSETFDAFGRLHLAALIVGEGPTYAGQVQVIAALLQRPADLVEGGVSLWWLHPVSSRPAGDSPAADAVPARMGGSAAAGRTGPDRRA